MKIIGTVPEGFIITASTDELANLVGYSSEFVRHHPDYGKKPTLKIGDEIKVAKMYEHLHNIANQTSKINEMAAKLRTAADLITTLPDPLVTAKTEPDKPAS